MFRGARLPRGLDSSVDDPDGDDYYEVSPVRGPAKVNRRQDDDTSELADIFNRRKRERELRRNDTTGEKPSKRRRGTERSPSESSVLTTTPAQKKQKQAQPTPSMTSTTQDGLKKLSAALKSRADGYTKLIELKSNDMGNKTIEEIEASVTAEVTEAADTFNPLIDQLSQTTAEDEDGANLEQGIIESVYKKLEKWEAAEDYKLLLRKKIMAEKIKAILDDDWRIPVDESFFDDM